MGRKLNFIDHAVAHTRELVQQHDDDEALDILNHLSGFANLPAEAAEMTQASLAEILVRRGKWTRARRHLKAALRHRPDCARYHYLMALTLRNDPDLARRHYRKALRLDPEQADCLADFGAFCLEQGDTAKGIASLRKAVELSDDEPALLERLTAALAALGRRDEARALLLQARFRHPRQACYEQLWNDFRYQETLAAQPPALPQPRKQRPVARPVLLPFPGPRRSTSTVSTRRDGPSRLSPPHLRLHPVRRRGLKQG